MPRIAVLFLLALILAAPDAPAQRRSRRSAEPSMPVSSFVLGVRGDWTQIVRIDPNDTRVGADHWQVRDARAIPPTLVLDRTVRAISSAAHAFLDAPLCRQLPTLHVYLGHERWGPVMHDNFDGQRSLLIRQVRALVEANCEPGIVETIQLALFQPTFIFTRENARYLDRYGAEHEGTQAGRYVYFGAIAVGDGYALYHHDANGLARYLETNTAAENEYARLAASRRAEEYLRQEGIGGLLRDLCVSNPAPCAGIVATAVYPGGTGGATPGGSNEYQMCIAECGFRAPEQQPFCRSSCGELVAR
jgi:hypothetical protein